MFAGEHINTTEDRAVLHVALRMPPGATLDVDGQDVVADVHAVLDEMGAVADRIRVRGRGPGPPAGASARWSTSASAARTSARPWPTRRWRDYADPGHRRAASSPTSTRSTSTPSTHDLDPADHAVRGQLQDLHHPGDPDQRRGGPRLAARRAWGVRRRGAWPSTSWPCPPTRPGSPTSASTRPTCSGSGTGSAAATPTTRPSGSR